MLLRYLRIRKEGRGEGRKDIKEGRKEGRKDIKDIKKGRIDGRKEGY